MRSKLGIKLGSATIVALALVLLVGVVTAPTAAAAVVYNETYPVALGVYNYCANYEPIFLTGTLHWVTYITPNSAGGLRIGDEVNFNVRGVSEVTGISYVGMGASMDNVDAATFPADRTIEATNLLVSQGGTPNLVGRTLIHETFDANGELTASTYTFTNVCTG